MWQHLFIYFSYLSNAAFRMTVCVSCCVVRLSDRTFLSLPCPKLFPVKYRINPIILAWTKEGCTSLFVTQQGHSELEWDQCFDDASLASRLAQPFEQRVVGCVGRSFTRL